MTMGQVWSKADCDGITPFGYEGGRGSILAVTAQNSGPDGFWDTADDLLTPLNSEPAWVTYDAAAGPNAADPDDRVRGFFSQHAAGGSFAFADSSTRFINERIDPQLYRRLSTRAGREIIGDYQ